MSATQGKGDQLGRYYTDLEVARAVVDWFPGIEPGMTVLEPSAGGGAFLEALHERDARDGLGLHVYAMDVDHRAPALLLSEAVPYKTRVGDFTDPASLDRWPRPDLVIGNPPYSVNRVEVARDHVERALQVTSRHVVFVLRQGFLGWTGKSVDDPQGRAAWWPMRRPRQVMHLAPRPSFTGAGTDASEYLAFWWDLEWLAHQNPQQHLQPFAYDWLPWGKYGPA